MTSPVRIPTVLRPLVGGEAVVQASGATVAELFADLGDRYPGLGERLLQDGHSLRPFVNVFVGDEDIRYLSGLDTEVPAGTEISILPAVAGG